MEKKFCLLASSNENKVNELKEILSDFEFEIISLNDIEERVEVVEDQDTFEGNARKKAQAYHEIYPDYYILADDSGLAIEPLNGRPGVYSARYGGEDASYPEKFDMLWDELNASGVEEENWNAKFVCAIAWWQAGRDVATVFTGEMPGKISSAAKGENGFGYDPIFYLEKYKKTSAEIDPKTKNLISHRGQALRKLKYFLADEMK